MLGDIERQAFGALYPVTDVADPSAAIAARLGVLRHWAGSILRKHGKGERGDHTGYGCRPRDQPRQGMSHRSLFLGGPEPVGCRASPR